MTQVQSQEAKWQALFQEQHSQLAEVAEMLLDRNGCPEDILRAALRELRGRSSCGAYAAATRAVVKAAIAYTYTSIDSWIMAASSGPINYECYGPLPLEALPWAERAVYFLREVLRYSLRETALLLGMSDSNVDQLNKFAARRMGVPVSPDAHSAAPRTTHLCAGSYAHSMPFAAYE